MAVNVWQLVRCAREIQKASPSLEPPLVRNVCDSDTVK